MSEQSAQLFERMQQNPAPINKQKKNFTVSVVHNVQCVTEYKGKHECNDKRTRRYKKKAQIELLYNIVTSTLGQINSRLVTTKLKKN